MALTDKDIIITPNRGQAADPKIVFSGADASTGAQNITLQVYPTNSGTLSFEGSSGQLFSITNSLTGTLYSVNDISGIPSIEVLDTGLIKLGQYSGNVLLGTGTDTGEAKLQVTGGGFFTGNIGNSKTSKGVYLGISAGGDPQIQLQGAGATSPHIDFDNGTGDCDMRIVLSGDDALTVTGGYLQVDGSTRSPIFYDSNDTGYYIDPASTSNLYGLTVASQITGSVSGYAKFIAFDDGPRNLSNRLPNSLTRAVLFDFVNADIVGGSGNYGGVMTFAPWQGTTASTGDSSYQLGFANATGVNAGGIPKLVLRNGIDSTWNSWHTIWHSGNDGSGSGLDADTLDGNHASAFATASHNHNGTYLTSYTDTLASVTGRGATTSSAITITNNTTSNNPTHGALVVSGGIGCVNIHAQTTISGASINCVEANVSSKLYVGDVPSEYSSTLYLGNTSEVMLYNLQVSLYTSVKLLVEIRRDSDGAKRLSEVLLVAEDGFDPVRFSFTEYGILNTSTTNIGYCEAYVNSGTDIRIRFVRTGNWTTQDCTSKVVVLSAMFIV